MKRGLLVAAALFACAPAPSPSDPPVSDAGSTPSVDAGERIPSITFTAQRDGVPTPVESVVYAEPFDVIFDGLVPGEAVIVQAGLWGYASSARFLVGEDGRVDLARDAPVEGSYSGVDADGLIWSMEKLNNRTESHYNVAFTVLRDSEILVERTLVRLPMGYDATVRPVNAEGLVGSLMVPPGPPRPVVVVVGGSEGGLDGARFSGAHVETMGYAVLALAYFDMPGLPATLTEVPLEYFRTAFDWLRTQPDVDGEHIVFMGGSRGGELALLVGATFPDDVDAVIAHVGSGLVFGSTADEVHSAWSFGGMPVPHLPLPSDIEPVEEMVNGRIGHRWAPSTEQAIRDMDPSLVDPARIHVENIAGPVLLVAGRDDGLWPSCFLSGLAFERLQSTGHATQHDDALHCYDDAGHLFGTPGWPTAESSTTTSFGELTILGGTAEGNGRAGRAYDLALRAFLARVTE